MGTPLIEQCVNRLQIGEFRGSQRITMCGQSDSIWFSRLTILLIESDRKEMPASRSGNVRDSVFSPRSSIISIRRTSASFTA
jgi:hypothetical protein